MKRLVLLGEGQGEQKALPVLARKLLADKKAGDVMYVDSEVIRTPTAGLAFWNKSGNHPDFSKWIDTSRLPPADAKLAEFWPFMTVICLLFRADRGAVFARARRRGLWLPRQRGKLAPE